VDERFNGGIISRNAFSDQPRWFGGLHVFYILNAREIKYLHRVEKLIELRVVSNYQQIHSNYINKLRRNNNPSKLTASRLYIYASPHTDRAWDPCLLQRFFEQDRTLTVCRFTVVARGGVEGDGIDVTH
jgi:hypothetical protein